MRCGSLKVKALPALIPQRFCSLIEILSSLSLMSEILSIRPNDIEFSDTPNFNGNYIP